eukprot:m.144760 g.144760  ORF g.144760 m.144760 type:complete len:834 (-) comp16773_c0_seq4:276-2777(-)
MAGTRWVLSGLLRAAGGSGCGLTDDAAGGSAGAAAVRLSQLPAGVAVGDVLCLGLNTDLEGRELGSAAGDADEAAGDAGAASSIPAIVVVPAPSATAANNSMWLSDPTLKGLGLTWPPAQPIQVVVKAHVRRSALPPASQVSLQLPSSLDFASRRLPSLDAILGSNERAMLLSGQVVSPGSFIGVDWFGRLDMLRVCSVTVDSTNESSASEVGSSMPASPGGLRTNSSTSGTVVFSPHRVPTVAQASLSPAPSSAPAHTPAAAAAAITAKTQIRFLDAVPDKLSTNHLNSSPPLPMIETVLQQIGTTLAGIDVPARTLLGMIFGSLRARARSVAAVPACILLTGPSGVGKSQLVHALVQALGWPTKHVLATQVFGEDGPSALRRSFEWASSQQQPSLLVIDDVDLLCSSAGGGTERMLQAHVNDLLDDFSAAAEKSQTILLAVTSRRAAMDPSVFRPGRLLLEVRLPVPSPSERLDILRLHVRRGLQRTEGISDADLQEAAGRTHGFVGADLRRLAQEAAMIAARRSLDMSDTEASNIAMCAADLQDALRSVRPSLLAASKATPSKLVSMQDLAGLDSVVEQLRSSLFLPSRNPALARKMGVRVPRGVVLHGPSGTGKTSLALACAQESGMNVQLVSASDIRSKIVGESESHLATIFAKARECRPCILLIDQLDALAYRASADSGDASGTRLLASFVSELDALAAQASDSCQLDVLLLATTSRIDAVDPAVLRPGRFDLQVHVPLPDADARAAILRHYLRTVPFRGSEADVAAVLALTDGCSGADLESLCRDAAMRALRTDIASTAVTPEHLLDAATQLKPAATSSDSQLPVW